MYGANATFIGLNAAFMGSLSRRAMKSKISSHQLHSLPGSSDSNGIRILVLHGKGSNGENFRQVLYPLEQALQLKVSNMNIQITFDYLTAPYRMSTNKTTLNPMEWWMLPPGVRSFQAKEYVGFQESASLLEKALMTQKYHFILGHSQGAILASIFMATSSIFSWNHPQRPLGCILNGIAWPNPFDYQLQHYENYKSEVEVSCVNRTQSLFIIGKNDTINPRYSNTFYIFQS